MKLADLQRVSAANLRRTYLSLGIACPGATTWHEPGFQACASGTPHPMCNFALDLKLDPWVVNRLVALASARPSFNVYATSSDEPEHAWELLERAGFTLAYRLIAMMVEPDEPETDLELPEATGLAERYDISEFMANQFFGRQPSAFRQHVAQATAHATELRIFSIKESNRRVAAVMLCEDEAIGLYNLCVDGARRGRGWGTSIVQHVLGRASKARKPVVLQCEPRLVPWYEVFGFEETGEVRVYSLQSKRIGL